MLTDINSGAQRSLTTCHLTKYQERISDSGQPAVHGSDGCQTQLVPVNQGRLNMLSSSDAYSSRRSAEFCCVKFPDVAWIRLVRTYCKRPHLSDTALQFCNLIRHKSIELFLHGMHVLCPSEDFPYLRAVAIHLRLNFITILWMCFLSRDMSVSLYNHSSFPYIFPIALRASKVQKKLKTCAAHRVQSSSLLSSLWTIKRDDKCCNPSLYYGGGVECCRNFKLIS
jgi:hypothetical protein